MQKIFEYWYINCINTGFRDTNSALGKPAYQISQMLNQWTLPLVVVRTGQYTCCPEHIGYTRLAKEDLRIGNCLKDTFLTFSLQPKMTIPKTSWFNRLQRNSRKNYTFWYSRKSRDYRINVNRCEKRSVTLNIFISRNPHHKGLPSSWLYRHGPGLLTRYHVMLWPLTIFVWQRSIVCFNKIQYLLNQVLYYKALGKLHLLEHKAPLFVLQFCSKQILQSSTFCIVVCTTVHLRRNYALVTQYLEQLTFKSSSALIHFYGCYQLKDALHLRHQCA